MWNQPTKEQLAKIPRLYETEGIPLKDKLIYHHFFIGGCDWYVAEYDGEDLFWGYVILNGDLEMAEWGSLLSKITPDQKSLPCFYWHFRQELEYLKVGFLIKMLSELSQI